MDIKRFLDIEKGYITLQEAGRLVEGENAEYWDIEGQKIVKRKL